MDSCVATLSDIVGLLMAESHYRLSLGIEWLDNTVRVIDSIGLGLHLLGYMMVIIMFTITLLVWRMPRSRAPMYR